MPKENKPNFWWSMFTMKCPRCRRGNMFIHPNPWIFKQTLKMPEVCPECGQPFELEVGFWYGTGYVSYGISFLLSVVSFALWWLVIGIDSLTQLVLWLSLNAVFLLLLQPWLMRLSRSIYVYCFVTYDANYKSSPVTKFDYESEDYYLKEKKAGK
jgi:Protein of unknown function (DUF983)